jgi:hypothetical protein
MEMQNHIRNLLGTFCGLIKDAEELCELPVGTLLYDQEKIINSVKSRGLGVFLLDFPSICSGLERSLEIGDIDGLLGKPFVSKGKPTIFRSLFSKIFTENGLLAEEPDVESIRCLRQIFRFAKKFRIDAPIASTKEKYLDFEKIEEDLVVPSLSWGADYLRIVGKFPHAIGIGQTHLDGIRSSGSDVSFEYMARVLQTLDCIQSIFDRFSRTLKFKPEWFSPKHGPGAVSEDFVNSKFEFPSWPYRLESKFPFDLFGLANHQIWEGPIPSDSTIPCKLIGVPKDFKGPRLIASEPIASQFIQQGLLRVLRENIKRSPLRHSIDFRSQEPSRDLALKASQDGSFSTIDLSSASDRLSCAVVECAFRRNYSFLELLNAARTPEVLLPDGKILRMKKFAAQGAAFTFPVQTIIYTLICMGVISYHREVSRFSELCKEVRVFGDDMIVPSDVFPYVCEILEVLQLRVNHEKSFHKGLFRESCGMDAYAGRDITPASVLTYFSRRDPVSLVSVVECSNNLYKKGFIHASRHLLETIPPRLMNNLAFRDSGSTVFGALTSAGNPRLKSRWNNELHRFEHRILTVEGKVIRSSPDGHSHLFQCSKRENMHWLA